MVRRYLPPHNIEVGIYCPWQFPLGHRYNREKQHCPVTLKPRILAAKFEGEICTFTFCFNLNESKKSELHSLLDLSIFESDLGF